MPIIQGRNTNNDLGVKMVYLYVESCEYCNDEISDVASLEQGEEVLWCEVCLEKVKEHSEEEHEYNEDVDCPKCNE